MSFVRARAVQSLQNGLRQSRPALKNTAFRNAQLQTKRFASSGHEAKPSSDLPWLITSVVITVPGVYYLWPSASHDDHHDSHDDHGEFKPEEEGSGDDDEAIDEIKATPSEGTPEPGDEKPDPAEQAEQESKKSKGADAPAEGEGESKPAEGNGNVDGVNFKGKVKEDSDGASHSTKVESDSKGEKKKRLDSGLAKNLGPGHEQEGSDRDMTTQDGKQKGVSNTQTRHSVPIHEDPEKSKKGDGTPETSKHIGTVDPSGPVK